MKYQIKFISGCLAEKVFPIENNSVAIGRSRSNDIKVDAPDVSGKHVILTFDGQGVTLDNLSSKRTLLDEQILDFGGHYDLIAGQCVTMGEDTRFVLESLTAAEEDSDITKIDEAEGQDADNASTVIDLAAEEENDPQQALPETDKAVEPVAQVIAEDTGKESISESEETIAMQTRIASTEELEFLKEKHQKQRNKKYFVWSFIGVLLVAGLITLYWTKIHHEPETFITWPVDQDGNELPAVQVFPYTADVKFRDICVISPKDSIIKQSPGKIEIETRLGKYRDVPLNIFFECYEDSSSLLKNRETVLADWMKCKKGDGFDFGAIKDIRFYMKNHGIPFLSVPYRRTINNESWSGYALLIRYGRWCFFQMKEVPKREFRRTEIFVRDYALLGFTTSLLNKHWEGMEELADGTVEENVTEAVNLLEKDAPSNWGEIHNLLRSALCKIYNYHNGDHKLKMETLNALVKFRSEQVKWYNMKRVALKDAELRDARDEIIQIKKDAKSAFSSPEDLRHHNMRKDKWD